MLLSRLTKVFEILGITYDRTFKYTYDLHEEIALERTSDGFMFLPFLKAYKSA